MMPNRDTPRKRSRNSRKGMLPRATSVHGTNTQFTKMVIPTTHIASIANCVKFQMLFFFIFLLLINTIISYTVVQRPQNDTRHFTEYQSSERVHDDAPTRREERVFVKYF